MQYKIKRIHPNDPYREIVIYGTPIKSNSMPLEVWEGLIWQDTSTEDKIVYVYIDGEWTPMGSNSNSIPSIGENGNWYIGDEDTGISAHGIQGEPGLSPYIGLNGNWWVDETDLGVNAQGPIGNTGPQGESGFTPYIGENGNWWINSTDTGFLASKIEFIRGTFTSSDLTSGRYLTITHSYGNITLPYVLSDSDGLAVIPDNVLFQPNSIRFDLISFTITGTWSYVFGGLGSQGPPGENGIGIPVGGTISQILAKKSNTDFDIEWKDAETGIPDGGTTGQVLAKNSDLNQDVAWQDAAPVVAPAVDNQNDASLNETIKIWEGTQAEYEAISSPSNDTLYIITDEDYEVSTSLIPNKNYIINGNFDIWQRGVSQTGVSYGSDDRWRNDNNISTKIHSRQIFTVGQTDVPNNPAYYSRTEVTSVTGAGNFVIKQQRIEDVLRLSGQKVTLSFYAKANATKYIAIEFTQYFGDGGSSEVTGIGSQKILLTTSWKKYTITTPIPNVIGKTIGANNYLRIVFWFDAGSNFNARTDSLGNQSGTFDIAQVKLEEGSIATPFVPKTFAEELRDCQRYFIKSFPYEIAPQNYTYYTAGQSEMCIGNNTNGTTAQGVVYFPYVMRKAPTINFYSAQGGTSAGRLATYDTVDHLNLVPSYISYDHRFLVRVAASGLTVGLATAIIGNWDADAEL